jgi:ribonuclease HI
MSDNPENREYMSPLLDSYHTELTGAVVALTHMRDDTTVMNCNLFTDNMQVVSIINGQLDVPHDDLFAQFVVSVAQQVKAIKNLVVKHHKGHHDSPWNEAADCIAAYAVRQNWQPFVSRYVCPNGLQHLQTDKWEFLSLLDAQKAQQYPMLVDSSSGLPGTSLLTTVPNLAAPPEMIAQVYESSHRDLCFAERRKSSMHLATASANVLTLKHNEEGEIDTETGLLVEGRATMLQRSFHNRSYDIIGVQEGRRPASSYHASKFYHVCCSGADSAGGFGCELWISKTLYCVQEPQPTQPAANKSRRGDPLSVTKANLCMKYSDPRRLIAALRIKRLCDRLRCSARSYYCCLR